MPSIPMKAPTQAAYTRVHGMPSGTIYTPSLFGFVQADTRDVQTFLSMGYTPQRRDRLDATTAPGATNDSTEDFVVGSMWINVTTDRRWVCVDATAAAALWAALPGEVVGGTPKVITYAGTITPNLNDGMLQRVTLTGNVTVAAPANAQFGDRLRMEIIQDATGTRTVALNNTIKVAGGTPTATVTANATDVLDIVNTGTAWSGRYDKGFA